MWWHQKGPLRWVVICCVKEMLATWLVDSQNSKLKAIIFLSQQKKQTILSLQKLFYQTKAVPGVL